MGIKSWVLEWLFTDIYQKLDELERKEVKDMSELGDALAIVRDQFLKAKAEILAKIAELEGAQNLEDAKAIAAELKTIAEGYDAIVPDVPV